MSYCVPAKVEVHLIAGALPLHFGLQSYELSSDSSTLILEFDENLYLTTKLLLLK